MKVWQEPGSVYQVWDNANNYTVRWLFVRERYECTCGFEDAHGCKHIEAVEEFIRRGSKGDQGEHGSNCEV
jgi:hypothetical protein